MDEMSQKPSRPVEKGPHLGSDALDPANEEERARLLIGRVDADDVPSDRIECGRTFSQERTSQASDTQRTISRRSLEETPAGARRGGHICLSCRRER